ncbi:cytochrome b5 isoform X1 [Nasonia vitripennis]|uniref:Cytochrome b5 heme-binding domain-containing protein n=2 Tax=Nasonia vitripennis TaxID=7425 RepID=A0A7M7R1G4_NASVI|nr:cytochrome b5 isoform X1 [Nasonia vitripennis]
MACLTTKRERYEMSQKYSAEEVSRHNNADDLWIAIHGKVFDVTKFLKEHPGGEEVLLSLAGGDATKCFDDIGHSQEAIQLKDTFEIGTLQGELTSPVAAASTGPTVDDDDWVYEEPKKEANPYIPVFIGLAVVVYAVLFYYIF